VLAAKLKAVTKMFKGIYAPIPTPFGADLEISWSALKDNISWWSKGPLAGLVVAGTNGEAALLDEDEKIKLFSCTRENLPPAFKVVAGTGCESARATTRLNRAAAKSGCDAVLVLNPSYFKSNLSDAALYDYYMQIAEESPLPVILYNMPRNTALNLTSALVLKLAGHPNIVGIKDSSGNIVQIEEIIEGSAENFSVFAGSASFLLPALLMGAVGGTLALANILPEQCVRIKTLFETGLLAEAKELQFKLLAINSAVTSRWGVAGLKAAMDLRGLYGGSPRLPLQPLSAEDKDVLKTMINTVVAET
jgi:4-hydroxy-2-oxoglutarate aldolase